MTFDDILLVVKENLRDEKEANWSNESLLDKIRLAYQEVAKELLIYQKSISYTHTGEDVPLVLPKDIIKPIGIFINARPLDLKSFEWVTKHRLELQHYQVAYTNFDGLRIFPLPKKDDIIEMVYQFTQTIYDKEVVLDLPELAKNALVFYTLYLANQLETRKESLQKSTYFKTEYSVEINKVKRDYLGFKNSKTYSPSYQRV